MVVARPVEPNSANFDPFSCTAPIVPTKILTDPEELDRQILQNGYATALYKYMESSEYNENFQQNIVENDCKKIVENNIEEKSCINTVNTPEVNGIDNEEEIIPNSSNGCDLKNDEINKSVVDDCDISDSETEKYTVTLHKREHGLGKLLLFINAKLNYYVLSFMFNLVQPLVLH